MSIVNSHLIIAPITILVFLDLLTLLCHFIIHSLHHTHWSPFILSTHHFVSSPCPLLPLPVQGTSSHLPYILCPALSHLPLLRTSFNMPVSCSCASSAWLSCIHTQGCQPTIFAWNTLSFMSKCESFQVCTYCCIALCIHCD